MRLRDDSWGDADRDPGALVRSAVDVGVTLLDTAEMYGNEEVVGRAIAGLRDEITLCTKFGVYWGPTGRFNDWNVRADPATVRSAVEGSLRRLGVDVIDLYYLHHRSDETPIEETVGAMAELRQAGKIRALGLSNVTAEDVRRAQATHPIAAVQEPWSLSERKVEAMLPVLIEHGITLVAHSPMGHGDMGAAWAARLLVASELEGLTPPQVALAWVHSRGRELGHPVVPIPGTTHRGHFFENFAASQVTLAAATMADLSDLADTSIRPTRPGDR